MHKQLDIVKIHGGVRFAIGPFNTEAHIDKAIEAIADIAQRAKDMKKKRASVANK